MNSFDKSIQTNGLKVAVVMVLGIIYGVIFPGDSIYLGPTLSLFMGLCFILLFVVPAIFNLKRLKNKKGSVINNEKAYNKEYRTQRMIIEMFSLVGGFLVIIGILFTILNYYGVV